MKKSFFVLSIGLCAFLFSGCVAEKASDIKVEPVSVSQIPYHGEKLKVALGLFKNKTNYGKGIFDSGEDKLEDAALDVLYTSLNQSGRFTVLDRENIKNMQRETKYSNTTTKIISAKYIISGAVVEFGRKTLYNKAFLFAGRNKTQIAYAKVNLNVIDARSSQIIYSSSGAGEVSLSATEVLGFGAGASYDSSLNDKVLTKAINNAINNLSKQLK